MLLLVFAGFQDARGCSALFFLTLRPGLSSDFDHTYDNHDSSAQNFEFGVRGFQG